MDPETAVSADQTAQDEFDAAFGEASAAPAETPEPDTAADSDPGDEQGEQQESAAAEPAPQTPTDPWAAAPEPLRNEYLAAQQQIQQLRQIASAHQGRAVAFQQKLEKLQAAANPAAAGNAPSAQDVADAAQSPSRLAQLKREYPEIGEALEQTAAALKDEMKRELKAVQESVQPAQQLVADLDVANRETAVERAHPGWKQEILSPQFHGWLKSQPRFVASAMESEDPQDAIGLLDLYKKTRPAPSAPATPVVDRRLERAVAAPSKRTASPRPIPQDDFDGAFEAFSRQRAKA